MQPTVARTLSRIARQRCPRCGKGAIFETFFLRADACDRCAWKYERETGFWVGGSEIHMFASYSISVILFIPLLIILGPTWPVQVGVILGHVACSLALFRWSRATFIGLDFYFDPVGIPGGEDDRGDDEVAPVDPRPRHPSLRAWEPTRPQPIPQGSRRRQPARTSP